LSVARGAIKAFSAPISRQQSARQACASERRVAILGNNFALEADRRATMASVCAGGLSVSSPFTEHLRRGEEHRSSAKIDALRRDLLRFCLVPALSYSHNSVEFSGFFGGIAVRFCITLGLLAVALAGSIGTAAAQYYPPSPGYQPYAPPPPPPGYAPGTYSSAPLPPPGAAPPPAPDGGYAQPAYPGEEQSEAYPPPSSQPYSAPDSRFPPQPPPPGSPPGFRPPAGVSGGPPGPDVTGTVPAPAAQEQAPAAGPRSDPTVVAALPPEDQPEQGPPAPLPPQFQRQLVDYQTTEPAGTIIVDTPHTYLFLIMGHGKALRYGIGVGREGFTWTGTERISRMKEWPDWFPPKEMIERQPYLPRFMAGGESNPLGARALYLGNTLYRIHGTNQPSTIGTFVSSGCIRLTNQDIEDLYDRVQVGTRVVVLPGTLPPQAATDNDVPPDYYAQTPAPTQAPVGH
jgi:lipoprotein-anchoring transpeptidase ErfK/SrfK